MTHVPNDNKSAVVPVLGTMTFGSQVDADLADAMVGTCLERGVTHIDTANVYNDGESERILGSVLAGRREQLTLASKVGMPNSRTPEAPLAPEAVRSELEGSLSRLNTNHLDLYYLHQPDRATDPADTLETLSGLVDEGKVRGIGVSNYAAWQVADLEWLARSNGWLPPAVSQLPFNLLTRTLEREYAEFAQVHELETIVFNPLAGGLLSGKYRRDGDAGNGGRFSDPKLGAMYRERYFRDEHLEAMEQLRDIAEQAGIDLAELAYRWLVSQPVVDGILIGASRLEQLTTNLDLCERDPLSSDVAARCDTVWNHIAGYAPAYNR